MATKVSVGRTFALMAALIIATSATVRADDDIDSPSTADATTSQDRAVEAQRLAKQAAALAKQAAALAAESQDQPTAQTKRESVLPASNSRRVESRNGGDMRFSEIDDESATSVAKPAAWRGRRQSQDQEMPIRFDRDTLRSRGG